ELLPQLAEVLLAVGGADDAHQVRTGTDRGTLAAAAVDRNSAPLGGQLRHLPRQQLVRRELVDVEYGHDELLRLPVAGDRPLREQEPTRDDPARRCEQLGDRKSTR